MHASVCDQELVSCGSSLRNREVLDSPVDSHAEMKINGFPERKMLFYGKWLNFSVYAAAGL